MARLGLPTTAFLAFASLVRLTKSTCMMNRPTKTIDARMMSMITTGGFWYLRQGQRYCHSEIDDEREDRALTAQSPSPEAIQASPVR
jgi:hypothetical protein